MELWDARYADGSLAGFDLIRDRAIPDGYYHLVVEVIVRHVDGTFLLVQRDHTKQIFPGWYEVSASGSALKGETAREAACRELAEETGITSGELSELGRQLTDVGAIFVSFFCRTDWPKDQIVLQAGETIDYRWIDPAAFADFFHKEMIPYQRERLTPHYKRLFE